MVKEGKKITGPEQLKDAASGCARIRGDTLGIVGLGEFWLFFVTFGLLGAGFVKEGTKITGPGQLKLT